MRQALTSHAQRLQAVSTRELFELDPHRATTYGVDVDGLWIDWSRQRVDEAVLTQLYEFAREQNLEAARDAMFAGAHINTTEDRAVLHTALRMPLDRQLIVDGEDVVALVHEVLDRMEAFATAVRDGSWRGATGKRISTVINIGIGGSDLGPVMAYRALAPFRDANIDVRFVSNVDPTDVTTALRGLDPATTLILVASKTFTTQETMANAAAARSWVVEALGEDAVAKHFAALSTNADKVRAFGIDVNSMFGFWNWVGGRYSLPSAIGLSLMIAIGPEGFRDFLAGLLAMDEHFRHAPLERNAPILMGLIGLWNRDFLNIPSVAVLPYDQHLDRLPAYLQQLIMESNGKAVTKDGKAVEVPTSAIYWGEPGTNGQHSFHQFIHQGSPDVACDVIAFARTHNPVADQHDLLLSNALAQLSVMAFGQSAQELARAGVDPALIPHKVMPGNRPATFILGEQLDAFTLGQIIALYEHMTFVQGVMWSINSFDQWGVELGKVVANNIVASLRDGQSFADADPATLHALQVIKAKRR